jgi:diguanylate cyclase (GGDEF)-like protein/PAS domain S-box-containing protein
LAFLMPSRREFSQVLLVVIGHVVLLNWALTLVAPPENISLMWLPDGFLLGCLVLLPMRLWPWVIVMLAASTLGLETWLTDRPVGTVAGFFSANMVESLGGAWLCHRFCGGRDGFSEYRHLAAFLLLCVLALPSTSAAIGAWTATGTIGTEAFWQTYKVWLASAGLGILFVAPLVLVVARGWRTRFWIDRKQRALHLLLLLGVLASSLLPVYLSGIDGNYPYLLSIVSLPLLILSALTAGLWGAVSAGSLLAIVTVQLTAFGLYAEINPANTLAQNVVELQVQLFAAIVSSLFIGLVIEKLWASREALRLSSMRYQAIFDHSPVALLEEDFAAIKTYLDQKVPQPGMDLAEWFEAHPHEVRHCSQLARIVSINSGAGEVFAARTHEDLLANLDQLFDDDSLQVFREELLAFRRGEREFQSEAEQKTLSGRTIFTSVRVALLPGHEHDWSRVIVVIEDITARKQAQAQLEETFSQLQLAVDTAKLGIWHMDMASGRLDWNDQQLDIYGLTRDEFDNTLDAWRRRVLPEDIAEADERFDAVLAGGNVYGVEFRVRRPDGEIRHITSSATAIVDEAGQLRELVGINYDITDIRRNEERLRQAATVFSNTVEGVTITDLDGTIIDVNEAFTDITGYTYAEVVGRNPSMLRSGRHDADFYRGMWRSLDETGQWRGEIWNRRKDGSIYPQLLTISAVREGSNDATGFVGVFTDITQIKRSEERLDHLAHHDPLTDLPNRLLLNERLGQSILHAARRQGMLAVVFIDLDRFKTINDSISHTAGDRVLQLVAQRLQSIVRADDTVARLSGDEFILLLENVGGVDHVVTTVTKLMESFDAAFEFDNAEMRVTASMGVALYPQDGEDADTLLRNADAAMYRAKEEGRNNYHFYTKELTTSAFEHLFLENALRQALERGEFRLVYQPQIDLRHGRFVSAEVLLRWEHPQQGTITPDRFIPIAEQSGLIRDIGLWVLRQACTQAKDWLDRGVVFEHVAVNIAGPQVQDPGFADKVEQILSSTGLPPRRLQLEVTEGFVMRHAAMAIRQLRALRARGIEIAIDDFGTGYSSLSQLKQLPIDTLKIDQSFVRDIPNDTNDMAISAAVVAMAGELGLKTIAEGVETIAQANFLRDHGCEMAQGFLYSRPVPASEAEQFLKNSADTRPGTVQ